MTRKTGGRRSGNVHRTDDDTVLFRQAMRDVAPLQREARPPSPQRERIAAAKAAPAPRTDQRAMPMQSSGPDGPTSRRLRRGQIRPEARLDLHGMTQIEAHAALRTFLRTARAAGRRCVLIVTGKGSVTTGGVLRREVPRWLAASELRLGILGIMEAQPKDGGAGALYVLLRKPSGTAPHRSRLEDDG